jgi:hypothetical protein
MHHRREVATVAALAVHIAEALEQSLSRWPPSWAAAAAIICSSEPENPQRRSVARWGRSCGGSTACATPSDITQRIFASPWSAAARGRAVCPRLRALARFPGERPA